MMKAHGEEEKTLLIASYREHYSSEGLQRIKEIILKEEPDRIIITKFIKEEPTPRVVKANVGINEREHFLESVRNGKKEKVDAYAADIIELVDSMDIPAEVHLRKCETLSKGIIDESNNMEVQEVIIHKSEKNGFEKFVGGCTAEEVLNGIPEKTVYME
ncbi:MAG: hypothetical protein R6U61_04730 [Thermoplasmata archaeon]